MSKATANKSTPAKKTDRRRASVKQAAFLGAYSRCGNITEAARIARVERQMHYRWMEEREYAQLFKAAHDEAIDRLERIARQRAEKGWNEVTIEKTLDAQGKVVSSKRRATKRRSDTLLMFVLNAEKPDKYKHRVTQEHTGPGGQGPVQVEMTGRLAGLSDEDLQAIIDRRAGEDPDDGTEQA